MGFLRKATFVATGGASGLVLRANSKKERTANALEKQARMQQAAVRAEALPGQRLQQQRTKVARHEAKITRIETRGAAKVEKLQARTAAKLEKHRTKLQAQRVELGKRQAIVDAKVTASTPSTAAVASSTADEIAKLAQLRDAGALTEDEFSAQKAKLLG